MERDHFLNKKAFAFVLVILGLLTATMVLFGLPGTSQSPNVVLITMESTRADHLGPCYGYKRNTTPNICDLADDSILFENAYSHATVTPRALPSLLTSLPPSAVGMKHWTSKLPPGVTTLAEMLPDHYNTVFRNSLTTYEDRETFMVVMDRENKSLLQGIETIHNSSRPFPPEPYFVWYFDRQAAHYPYTPSQDIQKWSEPNRSHSFLANMSNWRLIDTGDRASGVVLDDRNTTINLYDDEIRGGDARIGQVIDEMKERNEYNDSLIIFTSDHGESFDGQDHNNSFGRHGGPPYPEVTHVPLIVKLPGNQHGGVSVETPVQHADIMKMIGSILGVDTLYDRGNDLVSLVNEKKNTSAYSIGTRIGQPISSWSLRTQSYTYLIKNTTNPCERSDKAVEELYNRTADPDETNNIIDRHRSVADKLNQKRCSIFREGKELRKQYQHEGSGKDLRKKLEQLGYLQ